MNRKPLLVIGGAALLLSACTLPGRNGRQEWTLSGYNGSTVRFSLDRWKPGSHTRISTDVPFERFRGLPADVFRHGSAVEFEYVQDAGRLVCEGRFSFGRGSGTFTVLPDPAFVAALQHLDYDAPGENQLFDMMLMGVGLDDAKAAKDAGLRATTRQLIDMRVHGVDGAYIRDVADAGFTVSGAQDLIDFKIHGVAPPFLRDVSAAGYDISAKQVIDLRIHGVGGGFLRDAKALGYDFTPQELVNLRIHGVDGRYLRRLRDSGIRNLTAGQIQKLKINGVD